MKRTDLLEKVEVLRQFGSKRRRGGKKRGVSASLSLPYACLKGLSLPHSLEKEKGEEEQMKGLKSQGEEE